MKAGNQMLAFDSLPPLYLRLLDALDQSAIATTPDGTVVEWNDSAEDLYGWSRADAVGKNVVDVTPAAMSRDDATVIMQSLGAGTIWSGEFAVRTRGGESFLASVTDVPIVDDEHRVVGVVGLSARSTGRASLTTALLRLAAACDVLWPGRVDVAFHETSASVPASEPHLLQLLSLLVMRYASTLEDGGRVGVSVKPASDSVLGDFGIRISTPAVSIRIGPAVARSYSVLRDEISAARPSNFAASLVRLVGGWIYIERASENVQITHLLLPVSQ